MSGKKQFGVLRVSDHVLIDPGLEGRVWEKGDMFGESEYMDHILGFSVFGLFEHGYALKLAKAQLITISVAAIGNIERSLLYPFISVGIQIEGDIAILTSNPLVLDMHADAMSTDPSIIRIPQIPDKQYVRSLPRLLTDLKSGKQGSFVDISDTDVRAVFPE